MNAKQKILDAVEKIRFASGEYQSAVNGISGLVSPDIYNPIYEEMVKTQDPKTGMVAQAALFEAEAATLAVHAAP